MFNPIYRQIAEDLNRQIESGDLAPGDQLASESELQDQYQASRNTVRDAIKWLTIRGVVETRPGQGTFVTPKIIPFVTTLTAEPEVGAEGDTYRYEATATRRATEVSRPRVEIQEAGRGQAAELQLPLDAAVVVRHQERFIDGTPWSLQTSFYPMSLVRDGAAQLIAASDIQQGSLKYLRQTLGISQVGYRDTMAVRTPGTPEARFFGLPDDGRVAVVEIRQTAFDQDGTPFRLTVSVYAADRNLFAVNIGQVPAKVADPVSLDGDSRPDGPGTPRPSPHRA